VFGVSCLIIGVLIGRATLMVPGPQPPRGIEAVAVPSPAPPPASTQSNDPPTLALGSAEAKDEPAAATARSDAKRAEEENRGAPPVAPAQQPGKADPNDQAPPVVLLNPGSADARKPEGSGEPRRDGKAKPVTEQRHPRGVQARSGEASERRGGSELQRETGSRPAADYRRLREDMLGR
jgi:hypothetical protein